LGDPAEINEGELGMAESTGYLLAAAGIAAANEAIFLPASQHKPLWKDFNWRIIPATAIAAITLAGLEKISEPLGKGLAILALLSVLIVPMGNAPSPVENAAGLLGIQIKK
jgi:hypothetical protein